jgi:beta-lactamase superfamily II metal-dependent hydrolase
VKLTVFQSEKGDCLLLSSHDATRRVLVDGGMKPSYQEYVAPALGELAAEGHKLDLVYLSHIDQDHIAGVLQLMDDHVAWRVHDFQLENGNPDHPEPDAPRPPAVKEVWHNAFHEQVGENAGEIGDLLAATATILSGAEAKEFATLAPGLTGADVSELAKLAREQRELATSIPEAIRLSRRLGAEQLDIPFNKRLGGKLAFVRTEEEPSSVKLGPLRVFVIGPFKEDLDRLRKDWNKWLKANKETLAKIRKKAREDAEKLGTSDVVTFLNLQIAQAQELGGRTKVTPPNLASLMLMIVENGNTLLLTGDGHATDILKGLQFHGKLDDSGRIHVNLLKVQHHGSEHNVDEDFVSKVAADHYVFCGNGEHENPDLRVLGALIDSRLADVSFRATHPQAAAPFKLWFNSSESASKKSDAKAHMRKVMELVAEREAESGGRMSSEFLEGDTASFDIPV